MTTFWGGDDWQEYVDCLLKLHYGLQYQCVPAAHIGDCGIEGFSRSDGAAFQCYSVTEPVSTKERYEKQRRKMTVDLGKFSNNGQALSQLFGNTVIGAWVLVVPRFDSAYLVQHASDKAKEVRKLKLSYVAANFQVEIVTDDHFRLEREQLRQQGLAHLKLPSVTVPATQVGQWVKLHDELVDRMDAKLSKMPTLKTRQARKDARMQLLMHYLAGENLLDRLKKDYPYWYEQLARCKQHREQFLATNSLISGEASLLSTIREYVSEIQTKVRAIDSDSAEVLGYSTAADWLLRCPLDFLEMLDA